MAAKQYIALVNEVETLIDKYSVNVKGVGYIQDMEPSVNKSLQLFWARFTDGGTYQKIIEDTRPIPMEVFMKRIKITQEIEAMLRHVESDFTLDDVRDAIYHEEGSDDMRKAVFMFDRGGDISELENIIELVSDAWNYFPHKILNGGSPAEMRLKYG